MAFAFMLKADADAFAGLGELLAELCRRDPRHGHRLNWGFLLGRGSAKPRGHWHKPSDSSVTTTCRTRRAVALRSQRTWCTTCASA